MISIFNYGLIALGALLLVGIVLGLLFNKSSNLISTLVMIGIVLLIIIAIYFVIRYVMNTFFNMDLPGLPKQSSYKEKLEHDLTIISTTDNTAVQNEGYCQVLNSLNKNKKTDLYNKLLNVYANDRKGIQEVIKEANK